MRMTKLLTILCMLAFVIGVPALADNHTNVTNDTGNVTNLNITIPINTTDNETETNETNETLNTNQTNTTVTTTTNTTNVTTDVTTVSGASITIKEWYPQTGAYVFECNTPGMAPASYDWVYGDGSKSLGIQNQNVFHTYLDNGQYTVTCTGYAGGQSATASLTVGIDNIPFRNTCSNMRNLAATCDGGTVTQQDIGKSCRMIICDGDDNRLTVLACDKPSADNPLYFEMYRKEASGNGLEVCLGSTCVGDVGFARSPVQACAADGSNTVTNTTNTTTVTTNTTNVTNTTNTTTSTTWEVTLTGDEEVPPNNSTGIGFATVVLEGSRLTVNGSFNLTSDPMLVEDTPAHIHMAPVGQNGPVVFPLVVTAIDRAGTFTLDTTLNESVREDAEDGLLYINVHSIEFPSGELRAQLD